MTDDDLLWKLEHDYWTCGEGYRRQSTDPRCLMAFGRPTGIVRGEALHRAHRSAPDWTDVAFEDRRISEPDIGVAVLAYRARARTREGAEVRAFCTSVWLRRSGDWRHIQHQQTPA